MTELKQWRKEGPKDSISLGDFEIETVDGYINAKDLLMQFNDSDYCEKEKELKFCSPRLCFDEKETTTMEMNAFEMEELLHLTSTLSKMKAIRTLYYYCRYS